MSQKKGTVPYQFRRRNRGEPQQQRTPLGVSVERLLPAGERAMRQWWSVTATVDAQGEALWRAHTRRIARNTGPFFAGSTW
jgi:hypothetical protein